MTTGAIDSTSTTMNDNLEKLLKQSDSLNFKTENISVLGAGVGGCFTALELAALKHPDGTPKYHIKLMDKNSEILQGSSNVTPGRMGLGFHYAHKPTALMYLKATIEFQKKYGKEKDFRVGADEADPVIKNHLQHGRYFIMQDSKPSANEIINTYRYLQDEYRKLVEEDPTNKVFGEPEDFFRELQLSDYAKDVHTENVVAGVETAECLLKWPDFRKYIIAEINRHSNIEVMTNAFAKKITFHEENLDYIVDVQSTTRPDHYTYTADKVVNCTWENVRELNATAGIKNKEIRTNRLKTVIIIELPDELRGAHSTFFCMGPFAMFSNLGDGRAAMTYAPETSMANSTEVELPAEIRKYLQEPIVQLDVDESKLTPERQVFITENRKKAEAILAGVSQFKKGIEKAKILEIRYGIVQTKGLVDIFDPTSEFSRRDYNGIHADALNFVSNPCMKLGYGPENGEMVKDILLQHDEELAILKKVQASYDEHAKRQDVADKISKSEIGFLRYGLPRVEVKNEVMHFKKDNLRKIENEPLSNENSKVCETLFSNENPKNCETPEKTSATESEKAIICKSNNPLISMINSSPAMHTNYPNAKTKLLNQKLKIVKQVFFNYVGNCCCFFNDRPKKYSTTKTSHETSKPTSKHYFN